MGKFIDINNREKLAGLLHSLDAGAKPLWGKMKPQQMVEHLLGEIEYTNGEKIFISDVPAEEASQGKQKWVYSDVELPKNVILETLPDEYRFASLEAAINQLMKELADFDLYFAQPGATCHHLAYGPMNHEEWLLWHGKHFTHHFKQFGLVG
jgi:hypothetical protein